MIIAANEKLMLLPGHAGGKFGTIKEEGKGFPREETTEIKSKKMSKN